MVEKLTGWGPTDSTWWNWDLNSNPRASTLIQSCCFGHYVNTPLCNSAGSLPLPTEDNSESSRLMPVKGAGRDYWGRKLDRSVGEPLECG